MADRIYTVTSQEPARVIDAHGSVTDVLRVYWLGPNGIANKVELPVDAATPEQVDRAIKVQLEKQLSIAALGQS